MNDDELVVEMVGSGICHTDILFGGATAEEIPLCTYPRVLGHEGCLPSKSNIYYSPSH